MEEKKIGAAEEYSKYHVQGSLIKSRILYIHVNQGFSALKKILATLPDDVREQLSKTVYIGEWYPLSMLVMLDQAIAQVLAGGSERVFEELGVFSADVNLSGAYEPLVHQDVHAFLELTAVLHKQYQDFGEAQYLRLNDNGALLQFRYLQSIPVYYCKSYIGFFCSSFVLCS